MTNTILRNRYQIIANLGSGGFGQTFKAKDLDLPSQPICVVKQFKPQFQQANLLKAAKRLFNREAETLYKLGDHPQIPRLFAHFEQEQEFYLVQEYIAGEPLNQEITPGKQLSEGAVLRFLHETLQVLAFVHQQNVIHRDIKPANLMRRSRDDKIVLIDFGAVKEVRHQAAQSQGQTNLTVTVGSPCYMPCEQQAGQPCYASDIYALGIVCLQALTGLVCEELPKDQLGEHCCETFQEIANVSSGLAAILNRMVLYDYRERYYSATENLQELEKFLDQDTVITVQQSPQPLILEQPEGQVSLDSPFYVERPPVELDCYQGIIQPAALIRVKAPRQMGKSSLMSRILNHASKAGYHTVNLNFQSADAEYLSSLDKFLQWFCAVISEELYLEEKIEDYWKGVLGSKNKCTKYFQRYLLAQTKCPIALGLDEVDQIFQYPDIATDFFGLLRAWHEKGKNEAAWKKIRLIIVHSKEVYIPLNINQSPFNVGLPIELPELNSLQVADLVQRHNLTWTNQQVQQLMEVVGGHPNLVRVALYEIAKGRRTLKQLLQVAPTEEGPYGDHLRRHLVNLEENVELLTTMQSVVAADSPVQIRAKESFRLRSMGLVKFQGNAVVPFCGLYRQYFRNHF